jgi:hypothetical protein
MVTDRRVSAAALLTLAALMAGLALGAGEALAQPASLLGGLAPAVRATSLDGGEVVIPARGKVMLVVFWNTKYRLSADALGAIQRLHDRRRAGGLLCVGINDLGEDARVASQFVSGLGVTFPVVGGPAGPSAAAAYRVRGVPVVYVVDRSGAVSYVREGWDRRAEDEVGRKIEGLL